jgi:membrane fusion protein, multidrug efflux system
MSRRRIAALILGGAAALALVAVVLSVAAQRRVNREPLSAAPRRVTVSPAVADLYRDSRTYVGAAAPWVEASVGLQFLSAYVQTVLVRPGDTVRAGQVLATLDCTNPSAAARAVAMQARAVDAKGRAEADEAARLASMLDGGFIAPNEVEQKKALSASTEAQLLESKANLMKASLEVRDCVLRAPFDGEVATRSFDPGAFVRPGTSIVSVVDRDTIRVTVDAPEKDFDALSPGTLVHIHLLATDASLSAAISRRAPRADPTTRTIHFEVDVSDPQRKIPVGTTALVRLEMAAPVAATRIPGYAATQQEGKAALFVVEESTAHSRTIPVLGESEGSLFFSPATLPAGSLVVVQGRALLNDGDPVSFQIEEPQADGGPPQEGQPGPSPSSKERPANGQNPPPERDQGNEAPRGGGYGRPL